MKTQRRVPHLFIVAAMLVALLTGIFSFVAVPVARADDGPSVTIPDTTEHIDASATSFVVPIAFAEGAPADQISSVNLTLDYDETCIRIDDVDAAITGVQSGFEKSFSNNADDGKLQASIWRQGAQAPLDGGTLFSIRFTLEPICRHGQPADPTAVFAFESFTFGTILGQNIAGTATGGTYTLDINQAPTDISAGSLAMSENATGDRQIGVFSAIDSDTDPVDTLTFAFSTACAAPFDNQGFALDPADSANLRTDRAFDFEAEDEYPICVQVTDGQGGLYTEKITLTVVDVNDAPTDIGLSGNVVNETAAVDDVVGILSVSDEDAAQTYTYELVAGTGDADNGSFAVDGTQLKVTDTTINYATQPEYKIRLQVTDSGSPARTFQKQFRLVVAGTSSLALIGEPNLPVVLAGETITLPVYFTPSGNDVLTATFQVNYNEDCLDYARLAGIQSGYANTASDTADDGEIAVSLSGSSTPLAEGAPVSIVFTGTTCTPANSWTAVTFDAVPTMLGAGDASFATSKTDGKLVVLAADPLGDCNADGFVNAGDFSATALEIFDAEDRTGSSVPADSWLWSPRGVRNFSARGCDSNADRILVVADLTCTVRRSFGGSCLAGMTVAGAAEPAVVSAPAAAPLLAGQTSNVPLTLQTKGHNVAAFAASLSFDGAKVKLDPTDADGDGLPDAVHFQLPAGMYRMASYDAVTGRLDLVATGLVMPLPTLADGVIVTVDLTPVAGADMTPAALTLSNLSLGDSEGSTVPAVAGVTDVPAAGMHLFLPAIVSK